MPCRGHAGQEGNEGQGREAYRGAEAAQDGAEGRADGGRDLGRGAPAACVFEYTTILSVLQVIVPPLFSFETAFPLPHPFDRLRVLAGALHRTHVRGAASSITALPCAPSPEPPPPPQPSDLSIRI